MLAIRCVTVCFVVLILHFLTHPSRLQFFLEMLIYCFSKLKLLPKSTAGNESEVEEGEIEENPYAVLELDDEDDEMEEDEELFPSTPIPRPDFAERSLTLEELMSSDDRHDAVIFLFTMDELMASASHQYKTLVRNIQNNRQKGYPESAITEDLLESAVTSNFAIQQVQQLEMELHSQHEHLTTPYRLLATLAFPEITTNLSDIVKNHASKRCGKQDIIAFLGDCLECFFRNPSDRCCRRDTIVQEFSNKYEIDSVGSTEIDQLFIGIDKMVSLEVTLKPEEAQCNMLRRHLVAASGKPHDSHSWLPGMGFIGGDRAIHHTIRLLQMFGGVIESLPPGHKTELGRKGMFGSSPWIAGRSTKIRDLDELFMSDLLPAWTTMCQAGIVGRMKFPRENELAPLFMLLRSYVEAPHKPVSWSLAFGVHAMLTGILDVGKELYAITKASKGTFSHFFNQVKYGAEKSMNEQGMHQTKVWKHNIAMTLFLENFGLEVYEDKAIWNPLSAGTIFSIIGYFGNLEAGCATIDCQAQLRISLYIYHGLMLNGIISEGDVMIMDILYDVFKDCKAIWPGGKLPKKGELAQSFWIVFGMSLKESKQMAEKAQGLASHSAQRADPFDNNTNTLFRGRKMTPINAEDLSKSFRRICNRDFDDVKDLYHTPEQRRNARGSEQYLFAVRTNDTMDAIEEDQALLSLNFISLSYILEQFVCSIGRVLQWEEPLKSFKRTSGLDARQGYAFIFAQYVLGTLDFAQDPLRHDPLQGGDYPMGAITSEFMKRFFGNMPPDNYLWFQAFAAGGGTTEKISLSANL